MQQRSRSLYILSAFFGLYVLFLYGPTITIGVLSFQGPGGGLTFPMRVATRLCAGPNGDGDHRCRIGHGGFAF